MFQIKYDWFESQINYNINWVTSVGTANNHIGNNTI